jgi:two-component system CheB/CheR fusion protein
MADRMVLDAYGPPGVIVNQDMEILSFRGQTAPYIAPSPGTASLNLTKMASPELAAELRVAVHKAVKEGVEVHTEAISYSRNGSVHRFEVHVLPIREATLRQTAYLVLFLESPPLAAVGAPAETGSSAELASAESDDARVAELKREVASTREHMQWIIKEQEATNEELKAANEEIQSTNEELQSTNEELETAKEELQSTNEELATVNEELENRNTELAGANNDLTNLLSNVNLPILMLGQDLRIRQFTPQAEKLLNLISTDLGRPIDNIQSNIDIPNLQTTVHEVVDKMIAKDLEQQDNAGRWFSVRMRPYKTLDNRIDGVVITFIDLTDIRDVDGLRRALEQERRLATVVKDANDAITVQDFDGHIRAWNPAAERIYGYSEQQALEMNIQRIVPEDCRDEYAQMMRRLEKQMVVEPFETQRIGKNGRQLAIRLSATTLINEKGVPYAVATTEHDLSQMQKKPRV